MADQPEWAESTAAYVASYGQDYENSIIRGIPEVYGPKFQALNTETDLRLAFGRSYPHQNEAGKLEPETRYDVAVFLPRETVRQLASYLNALIAGWDVAQKETS